MALVFLGFAGAVSNLLAHASQNAFWMQRTQAPDASRAREIVQDSILIARDIVYRSGESKSWRLDMAMPAAKAVGNRPALVIVHGGGWSSGSKSVDV